MNDNNEMVDNNEIAINNEMVDNDEMVVNDEMVNNNEIAINNEMVDNDEMVVNDEMVNNNEIAINNEMVDNDEMVDNNEMVFNDEMVNNTERIFSFGTNEAFVNDIQKSREEGLLTDVKFIKNYFELEAIIINLALYINENLSDKECEKRAKNLANQMVYYLKEIPKTEQITFISFFRDSPFAINIIKETTHDGNLSASFGRRYNFFRQFVLERVEKGLMQWNNADESSKTNPEQPQLLVSEPDKVEKGLTQLNNLDESSKIYSEQLQLVDNEPDEVKKELHNNVFKGNAFEVFEMYKEKKLITLQSRTDLRVIFDLMKKDNLLLDTIELKHYIKWINEMFFENNISELKKQNLFSKPNIIRTNDYSDIKKATLKQP
jgi:hypothetical protein